jgi:hypothetical protein
MFLIISVRLRGIFRGKNLTQNSRCQSVKYFKGPRDEGRNYFIAFAKASYKFVAKEGLHGAAVADHRQS